MSHAPGVSQMKDPLSNRTQPEIGSNLNGSASFDRAGRHLSLKDIVMLAGLVAGAYVIAANFGETTPWAKLNVDDPHSQSFCSDEELRNMRGGHDACFDPSTLHRTESDREPSLRAVTNS